MLPFTDADDQGAAFAGGDDSIGRIPVQQYDDIGAYHSFKRDADGFFQTAIVVLLDVLDEVEEHLRIGIAFKDVSFFKQFAFELGVILDNAVVDHGQPAAGGAMGVRVAVAGLAVGGP